MIEEATERQDQQLGALKSICLLDECFFCQIVFLSGMIKLVVSGVYHTSIVLECVHNNLALESHLVRIGDVLQLTSCAFPKVFAQNVLL